MLQKHPLPSFFVSRVDLIHLFLALNFYCHFFYLMSNPFPFFVQWLSNFFPYFRIWPFNNVRPQTTTNSKKTNHNTNNTEFQINCEIFHIFFFYSFSRNENIALNSQQMPSEAPYQWINMDDPMYSHRLWKYLNANFIQKLFAPDWLR